MIDVSDSRVSKNLITQLLPTSTVAEAYRTLRTNLQYASIDKKIKSVLITSPEIKDGKTVTACNLAISIANTDQKVLLIDADLRKPNVHNQFKLSNTIGLTNIIVDDVAIEDALHDIKDIPNLSVLTCGVIPPNPSELLSSNKTKRIIQVFEKIFDVIIIDTAPIGLVSDGIVIAGYVDGVLLTISAHKTKISLAQNIRKSLDTVNANILGVIMTKVPTKKKGYYDYK